MSDKSKNRNEYTVDEILAEFDSKQGDDTSDISEDIPDIPEDEEVNEVCEPDMTDIKTEPVLAGVEPAESFDSAPKPAIDPFAMLDAEKKKASETSEEKPKKSAAEIAEDAAEEAFSEWNDIVVINTDNDDDDTGYAEEIEEEEVPEEERRQKTVSDVPEADPEVITAEEDKEDPDSSDADEAEKAAAEDAEDTKETHMAKENDPEEKIPEGSSSDTEEKASDKGFSGFIRGLIPWKGDSIAEIIRKIIFMAALIVFIGAGIMLAQTLIQSRRAVDDLNDIKEVVTTTVATTIDSEGNVVTVAPTEEEESQHNFDIMSYYKGISEDVVGFIELEGCDIYQPVVQGDDNSYYLKHTYYGESNKAGAIFADYRCTISDDYMSPNIVLYGHNQEDGTMFGNLKNYKQNVQFYAENPTITLRTDTGASTYLIYGFFVTNALANQDSNGEVFHYHDYIEVMNDEYTFNWYIGEVQKRNQIISPVEVEYGDELLCLSTCSNEFSNSRFVVFARKLRDGESVSDYDFSQARLNPSAKGVDWTAILSGETTSETTESESETESETEEETEETEETTSKKKKKKETSEETSEKTTEEETTSVAETKATTTAPETTEETSKTKRVDRTKTKPVTATTTETESESEQAETEVPSSEDGGEETTETAGVSAGTP
jgi:sortase B